MKPKIDFKNSPDRDIHVYFMNLLECQVFHPNIKHLYEMRTLFKDSPSDWPAADAIHFLNLRKYELQSS